MMNLNTIFKNTSYDTTMFSDDVISAIESSIFVKNVKGTDTPYIKCLVREKDIIAWQEHMGLDTLRCACRVTQSEDGGKRKQAKDLLAKLESETPAVVVSSFSGIRPTESSSVSQGM